MGPQVRDEHEARLHELRSALDARKPIVLRVHPGDARGDSGLFVCREEEAGSVLLLDVIESRKRREPMAYRVKAAQLHLVDDADGTTEVFGVEGPLVDVSLTKASSGPGPFGGRSPWVASVAQLGDARSRDGLMVAAERILEPVVTSVANRIRYALECGKVCHVKKGLEGEDPLRFELVDGEIVRPRGRFRRRERFALGDIEVSGPNHDAAITVCDAGGLPRFSFPSHRLFLAALEAPSSPVEAAFRMVNANPERRTLGGSEVRPLAR